MVEIKGMINSQPISNLIDLGESMSYISPRIFELCKLVPKKFDKSWLVQLATGTKCKVTRFVKNCELLMNYFITHVDLNIIPLGSYDLLIGIDWIEKHRVMLNCFDKTFTCIDDTGNTIKVKGTLRKVTIKEISALQMKISVCKGCKVFVFYVVDDKDNENKFKIEYIPIFKGF